MSKINVSTQRTYRLGEVVPIISLHNSGCISLHSTDWSGSDGFCVDFQLDCEGHRKCVKKLAEAFGWVVTEKEGGE